MKKLFAFLALFIFGLSANAITVDLIPKKEHRALVSKIGYTILNSNRIPEKMTFSVKNDKRVNAWTYYSNNEIVVTNSLIESLTYEDELAGIIAHEISHGVDYRKGVLKGYFTYLTTSLTPRKYEYKADKRAIDYMVKAGYNPLGMITYINKSQPQKRYDTISRHNLTSKRLANIYEYIFVKHPYYLKYNDYITNEAYQHFLLTSIENRKKLHEKIKSGSNKAVDYE